MFVARFVAAAFGVVTGQSQYHQFNS